MSRPKTTIVKMVCPVHAYLLKSPFFVVFFELGFYHRHIRFQIQLWGNGRCYGFAKAKKQGGDGKGGR
jgi:hypothetical protein